MRIYILNISLILLGLTVLSGCGPEIEETPKAAQVKSADQYEDIAPLAKALTNYEIDEALVLAKNHEPARLAKYFESQLKKNASLPNYGILLDLGAINEKNRDLFKPKIDNANPFQGIPNRGDNCWFISPLMVMASMSEFDELLEIDADVKRWQKRQKKSREYAENILRHLRQFIYEIRLGPATTSSNIGKLRVRLENSLESLDDEILASIYYDIFNLYEIDAYHNFDELDVYSLRNQPHSKPSYDDILLAVKNGTLTRWNSLLGTIANLKGRKGGLPTDLLLSLLVILDPFGKTARFLSFIEKELGANDVYDPREPDNFFVAHHSASAWRFSSAIIPVGQKFYQLVFVMNEHEEKSQPFSVSHTRQVMRRSIFELSSSKSADKAYKICSKQSCMRIAHGFDPPPSDLGVVVAVIKNGQVRGVGHAIAEIFRGQRWFRHDNASPAEIATDSSSFAKDVEGDFHPSMRFLR